MLRTIQAVSHASHVYGKHFLCVRGKAGSAVPHFFIDCEQKRDLAAQGNLTCLYCLGKPKENGGGKLVIQKTAFDIAAVSYDRAWLHCNKVSVVDSQLLHSLFGMDVLIQQNLHMVFRLFLLLVSHMRRRIRI